MSGTLYLIRYRADYRHQPYEVPPRIPGRLYLCGFSSLVMAENYLKHLPLPFHINPFEDNTMVGVLPDGTVCSWHRAFHLGGEVQALPFGEFCQWLRDLGLAPPELLKDQELTSESQILRDWWDQNCDQMTLKQKHAIWSWCDPQPYEIVEVELSPIIGGGEERAGGNENGGNRT